MASGLHLSVTLLRTSVHSSTCSLPDNALLSVSHQLISVDVGRNKRQESFENHRGFTVNGQVWF